MSVFTPNAKSRFKYKPIKDTKLKPVDKPMVSFLSTTQ